MNLAEFQDVLDVRGTDLAAWPHELRLAAERLVAADAGAEALLRQARRMDELITRAAPPSASLDAAAVRVIARVTRELPRQRRLALAWPAALLEVDFAP